MAVNCEIERQIALRVLQPGTPLTDDNHDAADEESTARRMRYFSGLVCKIKLSSLWDLAPMTATRMRQSRLSIPLFATYSHDVGLTNAASGPPIQRVDAFLKWLASSVPRDEAFRHAGLEGLAVHERSILRFRDERKAKSPIVTVEGAWRNANLALTEKVKGYSAFPNSESGCDAAPIASAECVLTYQDGQAIRIIDGLSLEVIRTLASSDQTSLPKWNARLGAEVDRLIDAGCIRVTSPVLIWKP